MPRNSNIANIYGLCVFIVIIGLNVLAANRFIPKRHSLARDHNRWKENTGYEYETFFFKQQVDHFGFLNQDTFNQRYLVAKQFWDPNNGPIFFYTGNEGDISWFCNNTGFLWDIAPEFKALLIFAEHRYYGQSVPYGPDVYKDPQKLQYLTSEQALADFAVLIGDIKSTNPGLEDRPVVAFGGSYGGMLAAWMRLKYPNVIVGSLAASAPIWQFTGLTPCEAFDKVVTSSFGQASKNCEQNIRNSWHTLDDVAKTEEGMSYISSTFHLCSPLKTADDVEVLKSWLSETWVDLAMVNYPYPADFLEPLPAWPVKAACTFMSETVYQGENLVQQLALSVMVYYNYTGNAKCLNTSQEATQSLGTLGWDYQACSEMVMPSCADGQTDMFEPVSWNFQSYSDQCYQTWKIRPRENWIVTEYWGKNLSSASNIIFSNGLLDPWSSGGVLESPSETLYAIVIPDGAHHLDLRSANAADTPSVKKAREQEKQIIQSWL